MKTRELRKRISQILVKNSMPTRQKAISEIVELIEEREDKVWDKATKTVKKILLNEK